MWVEKNLSIWTFYQLQANLIMTNANTKNSKLTCWPWRQWWSSKECSHMRGWAEWRRARGASILYVPFSGGEEADEQRLPERFGWALEWVVCPDSLGRAWKDHAPLRKTNKQAKNWGLPLLTCRQKAKKKCLQMGVRCDSQVLRVSVKLSLEGRDLMGVMLALKSPRNGSSSERAESTERTTDTQLPRGSRGGSSSFPGASEPQPFPATRNHLWK